MGNQNKKIYEDLIARPINLKVFEENVDPKKSKCFINDIHVVYLFEIEVTRTMNFGLEWYDGQPTYNLALKTLIICRMQCLP